MSRLRPSVFPRPKTIPIRKIRIRGATKTRSTAKGIVTSQSLQPISADIRMALECGSHVLESFLLELRGLDLARTPSDERNSNWSWGGSCSRAAEILGNAFAVLGQREGAERRLMDMDRVCSCEGNIPSPGESGREMRIATGGEVLAPPPRQRFEPDGRSRRKAA